MSNLVPLSKADKKKLGIVDTKQGLMIDKSKLGEIKKFKRPDSENPNNQVKVKSISVEEMVKESINQKDEDKGIY